MTEELDVLVKNGTIVDGTGRAAFSGSIGIKGDRITAVGQAPESAAKVIDAKGHIICPGFVDPHSHVEGGILKYPLAENAVMQGITTFVGGHCGGSAAPVVGEAVLRHLEMRSGIVVNWRTFGEFLDRVESSGLSLNFVPLVGHNTLRLSVMGEDFKRRATADEIGQMQAHVGEAMRSGAFGLSVGLDSSPGEYADLHEQVELAKIAQRYGGLFFPHVRHNQSQWPADNLEEYSYGLFHGPIEDVWVGRYRGYKEAVDVGRGAHIPVHIAHLAYAYNIPQPHPEFLAAAVAKATLVEFIDKPRAEGVTVTYDTIFSVSGIGSQAPLVTAFGRWLEREGKSGLLQKLKTAEFRAELRRAFDTGKLKLGMIHPKADPYCTDCFRITETRNANHRGKTLAAIISEMGLHPTDVLAELILEDPDAKWAQIVDKKRTPPGFDVFLQHPAGMPCSDMTALPRHLEPDALRLPPPTAYGVYPGYIDTYVNQRAVIGLEEAIRKATSLPAQTVGIKDRGVLEPGAYADVLVFDRERIRMAGDIVKPDRAPEGIDYVIVNGTIVCSGSEHTGAKPGKVIRRT